MRTFACVDAVPTDRIIKGIKGVGVDRLVRGQNLKSNVSDPFDSCNERDEGTIRLVVRGSESQAQAIEAVIDTGFNGFLTLSPALVQHGDLDDTMVG